ncbi:MAG: DMT family transporter [Alphaproteobacteria bacterium]
MTTAGLTLAAKTRAAAIRRGVILLACGIFVFTAMDALAKVLVQLYPTVEVVWARFAGHFLCVVLYLRQRFWSALVTSMPFWHVARSLSQIGATVFFFASLNYVSLAEATALAAISPVLITLGAALFLGERLSLARGLGVAAALLGALIILRPGMGVFSLSALLPVISAFCYAANLLLTRLVGSRESPWAAMIYASAAGTLLSSLVLPWVWQPIAPQHVPAFLLLGALGAAAQLLIIKAYSSAEAGALAPFGYLDIVFATVWSVAAFGVFPDAFTLIGALVIAASGLYVWRQEAGLAKTRPSGLI